MEKQEQNLSDYHERQKGSVHTCQMFIHFTLFLGGKEKLYMCANRLKFLPNLAKACQSLRAPQIGVPFRFH